MMIRSQAIKLIGVDDKFVEFGHVVVDDKGCPEVVMLNGDTFIAVDAPPPNHNPSVPLSYRRVRPFRFVRRPLP
jgi:hypothetical protein